MQNHVQFPAGRLCYLLGRSWGRSDHHVWRRQPGSAGPGRHTAHCTLHTPNLALHMANCTAHSTVYCTVHCTLNCTLNTAHCPLHTAHCTVFCCALYSVLETARGTWEPVALFPGQAVPALVQPLQCTAVKCTAV